MKNKHLSYQYRSSEKYHTISSSTQPGTDSAWHRTQLRKKQKAPENSSFCKTENFSDGLVKRDTEMSERQNRGKISR